jgi:hypothetical protein
MFIGKKKVVIALNSVPELFNEWLTYRRAFLF